MHMVSSGERENTSCMSGSSTRNDDFSALKNGAKIRKCPLGGVTKSEPANQKREQ